MSEWKHLTEDSRARWNEIADYWDDYMGDLSNRFHREIVRPKTEELLAVNEGQTILDIACGNGNFSRRLAEMGAKVIAFDYSPAMIERAIARSGDYSTQIEFHVIDAANYNSLLLLGEERFDSAVANMALMDIADITHITKALQKLLVKNGTIVFSIPHPCFQSPSTRKIHETEDMNGEIITRNSVQISKYLTPEPCQSIGIKGQPVPHFIFHRTLTYYMNLFFQSNFVLDGFEEPHFETDKSVNDKFDWYELPPAVILRFRKR